MSSTSQKRAQKRKYTGGRSEHRYGKRQRLPASAARGHPALLCSCDQHREREAVNELQELLGEYADEIFPETAGGGSGGGGSSSVGAAVVGWASDDSDGGAEGGGAELSIEAELAAEIASLKEQRASGSARFSMLDTGCKGLLVVRINDARVDPVALVDAIFRDADRGVQKARYISRLLPLQACCVADEAQIVETAKPLLDAAFAKGSVFRVKQAAAAATGGAAAAAAGGAAVAAASDAGSSADNAPLRWSVVLKKRHTGEFSREECYQGLYEHVAPLGGKVHHDNPELMIMIEIVKNVAGVAAVDAVAYKRFRRYNLRLTAEDANKAVATAATTAATNATST